MRMVLQVFMEIVGILNAFSLKVVLLKFWHVVDGIFMWVCSAAPALNLSPFQNISNSRLLV